ncbi:polysaccharide deacetylase family protein [Marinobacter sp. VGCF2001]|uniref:polysaccharide deacetylase family protein n=1 Tax=Marinobacter sp. VGCF2001 TaxID=3417189 RepID=UPI003CF3BE3F
MLQMKKLISYPLISALLLTATGARADLVVLQYHHVDDSTPSATSTSRSLFEAQLAMIRDLELTVVPLQQGTIEAIAGEHPETNEIAITFDDAYESVHSFAAPLLNKLELPYTVFVNTDAVGARGYMTWEQLRQMADNELATIANHSSDHAHLARRHDETESQWRARAIQSLDKAQSELKQRLEISEPLFAYPYGEFDTALEQLLSDRGWLGYGQQSGAIGEYSGKTRLPRFPMANAYGQLGSLKDKLRSKAFPVPANNLPDGVVDNNPPTLSFQATDSISPARLTCFASGLGRIDFSVTGNTIQVQAPEAINSRRFRYNCTHPAGNGSFYWLSQQWLNLDAPED